MAYDFETVIDRRHTHSMKWDVPEGVLPMWVADMDFPVAPEIREALAARMAHPVYGYSTIPESWHRAYADWWRKRHHFEMDPDGLIFCTGVVPAISSIVRKLTTPNENVLIQTPVYNIFFNSILNNGCRVSECPLVYDGTRYSMDFGDLEVKLADPQTTLMIVCNPHNPVGRIWSRDELARIGRLCTKHHVTVISDEIHCDMALFGNRHIPFASVSKEAAACSITFGSPSKTFNIAGIVSSYAIVPDKSLRERFFGYLNANEFNEAPIFSPIATIAAFTQGEEWRQQLVHYLEGNVELVEKFCHTVLPGIKVIRPQASFLVWLDCRGLGLEHDDLIDLFVNKAGLALNDGAMFGKEGSGFMRMNIGCPRSTVQEALEKLKTAIESL